MSNLSFGQSISSPSYENWKYDDGLIWQKVYQTTLPIDEFFSTFLMHIVSTYKTGTQDYHRAEDRLTFNVYGDNVDFKSMGGSWGSTALFVQYPMNYLVIVDVKEGRYRVTVKNIQNDLSRENLGLTELDEVVMKKKNTQFSKSLITVKGMGYINQHFSGKFDLSSIKEDNDDW